jgi:hypothetical protein
MTPAKSSWLFTVTLIGESSISAANAKYMIRTASLHSHDGLYAVNITTRHGDCDSADHPRGSSS